MGIWHIEPCRMHWVGKDNIYGITFDIRAWWWTLVGTCCAGQLLLVSESRDPPNSTWPGRYHASTQARNLASFLLPCLLYSGFTCSHLLSGFKRTRTTVVETDGSPCPKTLPKWCGNDGTLAPKSQGQAWLPVDRLLWHWYHTPWSQRCYPYRYLYMYPYSGTWVRVVSRLIQY